MNEVGNLCCQIHARGVDEGPRNPKSQAIGEHGSSRDDMQHPTKNGPDLDTWFEETMSLKSVNFCVLQVC